MRVSSERSFEGKKLERVIQINREKRCCFIQKRTLFIESQELTRKIKKD